MMVVVLRSEDDKYLVKHRLGVAGITEHDPVLAGLRLARPIIAFPNGRGAFPRWPTAH